MLHFVFPGSTSEGALQQIKQGKKVRWKVKINMGIFAQIQSAILFTIKVVALFEGDPNGVGKAWYPLYEGGFAKGVPNKYEGDNVSHTLRI